MLQSVACNTLVLLVVVVTFVLVLEYCLTALAKNNLRVKCLVDIIEEKQFGKQMRNALVPTCIK